MESEDLNQAYLSFTYIQDRIQPLPPIPDTTQVRQREVNHLRVQSEMDSSTPRSGWSVHGLQSAWETSGLVVIQVILQRVLNGERVLLLLLEYKIRRLRDGLLQWMIEPLWGLELCYSPGGQDSQLIIPDGSARLETNYLLQTHDDPPAHIAIKNAWLENGYS
ncbi:hypothetical protein H4I96_03767 [Botrytis cinerea]